MKVRLILIGLLIAGLLGTPILLRMFADKIETRKSIPEGRQEVIFWHFWGGKDRKVVEDVVRRFNESQTEHWVRAIAMPGNNLQAKLFLSVAGGDPPDLVNQDDPILPDWAERGVIRSFSELAGEEAEDVSDWLFDSARRLSTYQGELYGVCNGLDVRALYYNKSALDQKQLKVPQTIGELNQVAEAITPALSVSGQIPVRVGYIPDSRRLWAWGYVFGGSFLNETGRVSVDSQPIVNALQWMQDFGKRYGPDNIAAFRQGDQSLTGKDFPLLRVEKSSLVGQYTLIMDGQWRVRDIEDFVALRKVKKQSVPEFGVCPLPAPEGGRENAGWVNGNFFVVPAGAKNTKGAWEFAKFWIGYHDAKQAAVTCAAGGWIPVSQQVVDTQTFRDFLDESPMFGEFVELAASPNQFPIPQVLGAAYFRRAIESAGYEAIMHPDRSVAEILKSTGHRIQNHLDRVQLDIKAQRSSTTGQGSGS